MSWAFDWLLSLVPWWGWFGLFAGIAFIVWGFVERTVLIAWAVAGWKGMVGALIIVGTALLFVVSIFRPKKHVRTEDQYPDPGAPLPRRPPLVRKPGSTVSDWFKRATGQD